MAANDTVMEDDEYIAVPPGGNANQPIELDSRDILNDPEIIITDSRKLSMSYRKHSMRKKNEITLLCKEKHSFKGRMDTLENAMLAWDNQNEGNMAEMMKNSADIQKYTGEYKGLRAEVDVMQKKTIENTIRAHTITKIEVDNKTIEQYNTYLGVSKAKSLSDPENMQNRPQRSPSTWNRHNPKNRFSQANYMLRQRPQKSSRYSTLISSVIRSKTPSGGTLASLPGGGP